jgi:3-methyladenine DNA glycosylase AlkD
MNYASKLIEHMSKYANPSQAPGMEAYMKHHFVFFGIKSEVRKNALKSFIADHGLPTDADFESTMIELWQADQREVHYCAQELFFRKKWYSQEQSFQLIETMITTNSWWDTVDFIAANICGAYFKAFPEKISTIMPIWNLNENRWLIRSSFLFQLKYKTNTDLFLLEKLFEPHLKSKEFFIQKAIGWMLRDISKHNPSYVARFVNNHELMPVSLREAMKYI